MKLSFLKIGFLFLLLSAFVALWAEAQTGEGEIENWVNTRILCQSERHYLLEVEVSENISQVSLYPDVLGAWTWTVDQTKSRRFWVDTENTAIFVYVEVWEGGGYQADSIILHSAQDCYSDNGGTIPMVECLGMSLDSFIAATNYEPLEDGFVVDGLFYSFHENLSFFVPQDAYWTWDLYVDGLHLLRFEQTQDSRCHVTNIYPQ